MKNERTHIRLLILLIAGVLILAGAPASAEITRFCTLEQKSAGTCLEIYNDGEEFPVYIVKAVSPVNGSYEDANLGVNWPAGGVDGAPTVFTYWGGVSQDYIEGKASKPSAWSYIVFNLGAEPLDAEPPGAQLNLDRFVCGVATIDPDRIAYKLNPSVNFKGDAIFSLYAPAGSTYDPCNNGGAYVIYGKQCDGGPLVVPHIGELPFVQQRHFWCSEKVFIEVQYDQCTGEPFDKIYYTNGDTNFYEHSVPYQGSLDLPSSPYVYADMPDYTSRNFQVTNWGPAYGTLLCTDSAPVFVWKDRAYFCPNP